jgi:DNA helicase-2/ATP-dependent DNA helicase PcrA
MIQSFQVINENQDAFYITDHVPKKTGLVQELKGCHTRRNGKDPKY